MTRRDSNPKRVIEDLEDRLAKKKIRVEQLACSIHEEREAAKNTKRNLTYLIYTLLLISVLEAVYICLR